MFIYLGNVCLTFLVLRQFSFKLLCGIKVYKVTTTVIRNFYYLVFFNRGTLAETTANEEIADRTGQLSVDVSMTRCR